MPIPPVDTQSAPNTTELQVPVTMHIDSAPPAQVQTEPQDAAPDSNEPVSPRQAQMAEIFANRAKAIEKELTLGTEIATDSPGAPPEPTDAPAQGAEPQGNAPQKPATAEPAAGGQGQPRTTAPVQAQPPVAVEPGQDTAGKIPLMVNGRQLFVSPEELVGLAQKGIGAEEKFQAAARLREDARQFAQPQQAQPITQQQPVAAQPPQQASQPVEAQRLQTARDLARKINYGSEDEQAQALLELSQLGNSGQQTAQQGPSANEIIQQAGQHVLSQIRFENDLNTVLTEFKDVFEHRALAIAAADQVGILRTAYQQAGIPRSNLDLYREACTSMRAYVPPAQDQTGQQQPVQQHPQQQPVQSAPNNVVSMTQRLERKRAAPKPPTAATRTVADNNAQNERYMPTNIVANMRKSRGQPSA